jgi:hypothetical protein
VDAADVLAQSTGKTVVSSTSAHRRAISGSTSHD